MWEKLYLDKIVQNTRSKDKNRRKGPISVILKGLILKSRMKNVHKKRSCYDVKNSKSITNLKNDLIAGQNENENVYVKHR